eukprot:1749046-Alexandrium_andersonii.AAC.1
MSFADHRLTLSETLPSIDSSALEGLIGDPQDHLVRGCGPDGSGFARKTPGCLENTELTGGN